MKRSKFLSAILTLAMMSGSCLTVNADLTDTQKNCPNYSEMKGQSLDTEKFDEALDLLYEITDNPEDYSDKDVRKNAEILIEEFTHISTLNRIYSIEFSLDVKNEETLNLLNESDELYSSMMLDIGDCVVYLYDAGFEEALRDVHGYDMIKFFTYIDDDVNYSKYDDENQQLLTEIDVLVNEYLSYTPEDFAYEYDGVYWTSETIFDMESEYAQEEIDEVAKNISLQRNETLGNIYLEIIQKRDKIAKNYGYDNFSDYAYAEIYNRDYTPEEISELYEVVQTGFGDDRYDYREIMSDAVNDAALIDKQFSEEKLFDITKRFIVEISDDYADNLQHLKEHNLYNTDEGNNKTSSSFVTILSEYNVPYLFISLSNDYSDIFTFIHEFGHANAEYEAPSSVINDLFGTSIDTCEIHSQGLTALFAANNTEFTEQEKIAYTKYMLYDLECSIVDGFMYDEFQQYAYEHPDSTLEELNEFYRELTFDYGARYEPEDYYEYDWVEIPHNYDSPMYYISYAVSAATALDLWCKANENPEKAEEIYIDLVEMGCYTQYKKAVEESGLETIFNEERLGYCGNHMHDYFYYDEYVEYVEPEGKYIPAETKMLLIACLGPIVIVFLPIVIVLIVLVIIAIVMAIRKKTKKKIESDNSPEL